MVNTKRMKQWFCILFLSIVFVANSSAAMLMPIQMLSTTPVSGNVTKATMPCHQMAPLNSTTDQTKITDSTPSGQHCPNCVKMGHTAIADGCGSCSCFSVSGFLSVSIELIPLSLPSPEYTDNYLIHFTSIPRFPLLRPPQSV